MTPIGDAVRGPERSRIAPQGPHQRSLLGAGKGPEESLRWDPLKRALSDPHYGLLSGPDRHRTPRLKKEPQWSILGVLWGANGPYSGGLLSDPIGSYAPWGSLGWSLSTPFGRAKGPHCIPFKEIIKAFTGQPFKVA